MCDCLESKLKSIYIPETRELTLEIQVLSTLLSITIAIPLFTKKPRLPTYFIHYLLFHSRISTSSICLIDKLLNMMYFTIYESNTPFLWNTKLYLVSQHFTESLPLKSGHWWSMEIIALYHTFTIEFGCDLKWTWTKSLIISTGVLFDFPFCFLWMSAPECFLLIYPFDTNTWQQ